MLSELNEVQSRKAGKTEKMSFKNIKDVLSRDEMKWIMAGSGGLEACGGCFHNGYGSHCVKGGNLTGCTCMAWPGKSCVS